VLAIVGFWFNHRERKAAELRTENDRKVGELRSDAEREFEQQRAKAEQDVASDNQREASYDVAHTALSDAMGTGTMAMRAVLLKMIEDQP